MKLNKFLELYKKDFKRQFEIVKRKNYDYATTDCLSNFKRVPQIANILRISNINTPVKYCLFYIIVKLDRISNLLSNDKSPKNESLLDSLDDMQNYIQLLKALLLENDNKKC